MVKKTIIMLFTSLLLSVSTFTYAIELGDFYTPDSADAELEYLLKNNSDDFNSDDISSIAEALGLDTDATNEQILTHVDHYGLYKIDLKDGSKTEVDTQNLIEKLSMPVKTALLQEHIAEVQDMMSQMGTELNSKLSIYAEQLAVSNTRLEQLKNVTGNNDSSDGGYTFDEVMENLSQAEIAIKNELLERAQALEAKLASKLSETTTTNGVSFLSSSTDSFKESISEFKNSPLSGYSLKDLQKSIAAVKDDYLNSLVDSHLAELSSLEKSIKNNANLYEQANRVLSKAGSGRSKVENTNLRRLKQDQVQDPQEIDPEAYEKLYELYNDGFRDAVKTDVLKNMKKALKPKIRKQIAEELSLTNTQQLIEDIRTQYKGKLKPKAEVALTEIQVWADKYNNEFSEKYLAGIKENATESTIKTLQSSNLETIIRSITKEYNETFASDNIFDDATSGEENIFGSDPALVKRVLDKLFGVDTKKVSRTVKKDTSTTASSTKKVGFLSNVLNQVFDSYKTQSLEAKDPESINTPSLEAKGPKSTTGVSGLFGRLIGKLKSVGHTIWRSLTRAKSSTAVSDAAIAPKAASGTVSDPQATNGVAASNSVIGTSVPEAPSGTVNSSQEYVEGANQE